jgi:ribonuclease HI
MIVTINTDASFNSQHKIGAYAFWIVCDEGKIMKSGVLKEALNPTDAELRCICNALYCLLKSDFKNVRKIIINSDALYAFCRVGKNSNEVPGRKCSSILRQLKEKYYKPSDYHKQIHEFRHVKAHSGTESKRKWVNDWCDKAAKRMMREKVKNLNKVKQ